MSNVEYALKTFGNGVGTDGITASVINLFPLSLKEVIMTLMQNVFLNDYPDEWSKQILHSIPKSVHTKNEPKLRGIAVASFLCRVYDSIINERLLAWYTPNYEQAGFRAGQGCLNQIFILTLLVGSC